MYKKIYLLFFLLIISFVINAQHLGFKLLNEKKSVVIPFELHKNLIVIPLVLNNKLPLNFILDTGVRNAILFDKIYSDLLNLSYSKKYTISGAGTDVTVDAYVANNVTYTIQGIEGNGYALVVLENDVLELENYLGITLHGIIGYELFSRFIIEINYSEKLLTLTVPEHFKPNRNYDMLPMKIEDTKPYITACLVQSDKSAKDVKLMIDSGSSQSLILQLESDSLNLKLPEKTIYRNIGRGLGGRIKGYIGRVPALEIGKVRFNNILINYPESEFYVDEFERYSTNRNGTIGGEVLRRFNVIFDFSNEKFYYRKNVNYYNDFTYNLSGLLIKAIGHDLKTLVVDEVENESTGEAAGVLKGDTLKSINRKSIKNLTFDDVLFMLNSKEGKRIRLVMIRDGKEKVIHFRLKSII